MSQMTEEVHVMAYWKFCPPWHKESTQSKTIVDPGQVDCATPRSLKAQEQHLREMVDGVSLNIALLRP
jgi:hypothetical protein